MKDEIKKYAYIDALRGLAILGVILVHTGQFISPTSEILKLIAQKGERGVQLFFVASALTLFLSMDSRRNRMQEKMPVKKFFIRRFFRIAPLFYIALIVYTVVNGVGESYWAPNGIKWWFFPLTATFMHGWHPESLNSVVPGGWSIAIEMTFYLLVPFLFTKLNSLKRSIGFFIITLLFARVLNSSVSYLFQNVYPESQHYILDNFVFLWFFSQVPVFIIGIIVFHILKQFKDTRNKFVGFLLLSLFALLLISFSMINMMASLPQHILYGSSFLFLVLGLFHFPTKLLVNRFTILAGKLSFSLYLTHFIVIEFLRNFIDQDSFVDNNVGFAVTLLIIVTISIAISLFTHTYIEERGVLLGKKVIEKL